MQTALKIVLALLRPGMVEREEIRTNCDLVIGMLLAKGDEVPERKLLMKEVESRVTVWQDSATSLEDKTGHEDWLPEARESCDWRFWDRYRRYLEQVELLPPTIIGRTDESTDRVLSRLERPSRPGEWDRRGMVVGQVQSGKTGHYTALACKAADAGYKLIVVLAGVHNSLRSQTQLRLDEGLLGFDTQYQYRYDEQNQSRIGVGSLAGAEALKIGSLTTSHEKGDFNRAVARNHALPIGEMPVLLVVKKHGSILNNLITWVTQMHGKPVERDSQRLIVRDFPLLVIDDEADNASVNTKGAGEDPTVINRRIRELLNSFEKSAYVGYTATPFANIFSSTVEDEDHGLDLFPRHFIESLKPPSNYFGPVRVFGIPSREDVDGTEGLPLFREVADYQTWMPDKHKASWNPRPQSMPDSLRTAILSFFLVCAARRQRGQASKHNSMLIHTTRFKDVQQRVAEQVEELLRNLRYRIRYGDGDAQSIWDELEKLWLSDFLFSTARWGEGGGDPVPWSEIEPHIATAVAKIELKVINGDSSDALEYYEKRSAGLSVIAIGGDKLSRGLTLDGLSVSYYLRASRMYDTLMQMGRWFGYRPGYEDLCRLYTTSELRTWYREITVASEELRDDFDDMAGKGTPEEYGLRVRQSPAGLSVTAPSKMRNSSAVRLTFSGDISETITFSIKSKILKDNRQNLEHFVSVLNANHGKPEATSANAGNYLWNQVPGRTVVDEFLHGYRPDAMARRARPELISRYVEDGLLVGELLEWSVMLVNNQQESAASSEVAGLPLGLTMRRPLEPSDTTVSNRWTIRRLLSPPDESRDFSEDQLRRALDEMSESSRRVPALIGEGGRQRVPTGPPLRRQRDPRQAFLIIYPLVNDWTGDESGKTINVHADEPMVGFAVSFPFASLTKPATYRVNEIWKFLAFDQLEDDDDQ